MPRSTARWVTASLAIFAGVVLLLAAGFFGDLYRLFGPRDDLARMQGAWKLISAADGGRPVEQPGTAIVAGDRIEFRFPDDVDDFTLEIDSTSEPKQLDMINDRGTVLPGIYQLTGRRLVICFNERGGERPTALESRPDSANDVLVVMERE